MPTLSSSNRSQLAYKLEGTYPTNWGVLQGGNGFKLNMVSESLDFSVKSERSKQIRSDRSVSDIVLVGASAQGGVAYEMQYREYDPFIEGVFQNVFTAYGTAGVSAAIGTLNFAAGTITAGVAPTGADAFNTNLEKGQWFTVRPPVGATQTVKDYFNGRAFRVSLSVAPTTTVITLDAATQIDTAKSGASMSNGFISTSRMYNGSTMKSYTLEVGHEDVALFRQYLGMIPSKMDMKLGVGSIITGSFEFMGKSMTQPLPTTTGMGTAVAAQGYTPANATRGVFDIFEGGASISASTFIRSADISIDNSLRAQEAVGVYGNAGVAAGTMAITGKLEVYFADAVMYNKFLANSNSSMSLPVLDTDGNGYVFYFPRIKYSAAKINTGGIDQDNMLSMDFEAIVDQTAANPSYQKSMAVYRVGAAAV